MLTPDIKKNILAAQKNEITEYHVYKELAGTVKIKEQADVLRKISEEELEHYGIFKSISGEETLPDKFKLFIYVFISKVFGLNFGLRLMENGEDMAQNVYAKLKETYPEIEKIEEDEKKHEYALLNMIDEERLKYASSIVLGLNDALVELTAAIAGFTFAIQNTELIGVLGLITGIAAAMSMAASEYLAVKHEKTAKEPFKATFYTGFSYITVVIFLVLPYFLFKNVFLSLSMMIATALLIIFIFTFYISVAKNLNFKPRFLEMAGLSLSIATITFFIGMGIRNIFGIDI